VFDAGILLSTPHAGGNRRRNARRTKMRKIMLIAGAVAIAGLTGAAVAHEEMRARREVSQEQRISPDEMKAKLDKLGYEVRWLEQEHDKYEVHAIDRQSGRAVEAKFNAKTGELIRAKLDS
jgi:hypothetical protein